MSPPLTTTAAAGGGGCSPPSSFLRPCSPNGVKGATLATASWDKTVQLWDSGTGEHLGTLQGHLHEVYAVAFSPDARTVASGSWDNTVRLWDATTGKPLRTLKGHSAVVRTLAFSPDGTRLASGSRDTSIRLWDAHTGKHLGTLQGHSAEVDSLAFSPDGSLLASGAWDHTVRLWSAGAGDHLRTLRGHTNSVASVAFSAAGRTLASASEDGTVRLWDCVTGELKGTLRGHSMGVKAVAFAPDGHTLASASRDRSVRLWDAASGDCLLTLQGHGHWVSAVAFSPDGRILASASWDKTVKLWDARTGEKVRTIHAHAAVIDALAFAPRETGAAAAAGPAGTAAHAPLPSKFMGSKIRRMLARLGSSSPASSSSVDSSTSVLSPSDALSHSSDEEASSREPKFSPNTNLRRGHSSENPSGLAGPTHSAPEQTGRSTGELSPAGGGATHRAGSSWCSPLAAKEVEIVQLRRAVLYATSDLEQATEGWSKERLLGDGAFGSVYKGVVNGGLQVAIKRMKDADWAKSGLANELQALGSLRHPHIVALLGFCPDRSHPCLVYEYLPGGDLRDALKGEGGSAAALTPLDRIRIASEVASALQHLHQQGFQHRDLKPGNILLDVHRRAKLGDWGLALHSESTVQLQGANGTPGYVAPEVFLEAKVSPASDVYAFGVILLQLLTGFLRIRELHALTEKHAKSSLQDLEVDHCFSALDSKAGAWPTRTTKEVIAIALKCVARDRTKRPSLVRVRACLDSCLSELNVGI